jgi:DNA-binding transcriptional regulator GbsR (MarR family)
MKGTINLNGDRTRPYLKKILAGKGGYRIYFIVIDDVRIIFTALSAKKGSKSVDFSKQQWTAFYRIAVELLSDGKIQEVVFNEEKLKVIIE